MLLIGSTDRQLLNWAGGKHRTELPDGTARVYQGSNEGIDVPSGGQKTAKFNDGKTLFRCNCSPTRRTADTGYTVHIWENRFHIRKLNIFVKKVLGSPRDQPLKHILHTL